MKKRFTKANGSLERKFEKVKAFVYGQMERSFKDGGDITKLMEQED